MKLKFIDLFCGIGGFHHAMERASSQLGHQAQCVFSSDIDHQAREAYRQNFGSEPSGDITKIDGNEIPSHHILLGGFPCQAFSIIGDRKGFEDTRGTLFFDIARILEAKKPNGFVLENVKQLKGHDGGRTLSTILNTLRELKYDVDYRVLNALDFGLPQKRERVFIVGWKSKLNFNWDFHIAESVPLEQILEKTVARHYRASESIIAKRMAAVKSSQLGHKRATIWHENKSGNISAYEYSCALRAGASYNYLLVNGERRLTEREMLRLQGFPESHLVTHNYGAMRRFAGNALPVPVATAVISRLLELNLKVKDESRSRAQAATGGKDQPSIRAKSLPT